MIIGLKARKKVAFFTDYIDNKEIVCFLIKIIHIIWILYIFIWRISIITSLILFSISWLFNHNLLVNNVPIHCTQPQSISLLLSSSNPLRAIKKITEIYSHQKYKHSIQQIMPIYSAHLNSILSGWSCYDLLWV